MTVIFYWPRKEPMEIFKTADPGMLKLSCRTSMAIIPNVKRKITLFSVRIPGWISLILLFEMMVLTDIKSEETSIQPEPSSKNTYTFAIPKVARNARVVPFTVGLRF